MYNVNHACRRVAAREALSIELLTRLLARLLRAALPRNKKTASFERVATDDSAGTDGAIATLVATDPRAISAGALDDIRLGPRLEDNLKALRELCGSAPDLVVRRVELDSGKVAVVFYSTLCRSDLIAQQVIESLQEASRDALAGGVPAGELRNDAVRARMINSAEVERETRLMKVLAGMAAGKAALLFEGSDQALVVNLAGYEKRAVAEPPSEPVVRGPKDGFSEHLQTNLSLIRRRIGSPLLRFEPLSLGRWTQTQVVIAYIHGLAGEELVGEVRKRLSVIDIDGVIETSYIEEFIEDTPYTTFPQILSTERPDSVVASLLEGRVAVLMDGSPTALVMPTTLWTLMNTSEDYYHRWDGATFVRLLRYVLVVLVVLLPSLYVAATTFHPEMLPGAMLLSIAAAREAVPFSSFTEVFLMELTFEALREAGIRLPRPVGQTISIVGAIVLGEAAIQAQLVSAPVVIVVAFTGISSFVIPHFNLGLSVRIIRFPMLILAGTFGLFGISIGLMLLVLHLTTLRSFGVPYLSPISPFRPSEIKDTLVRVPWWRMFRRPHITGSEPAWRQGFPLMPHAKRHERGKASRNAPERS